MKKILIVDDLEPFIKQEKSLLARADFQIFTARSARNALEIHAREHMDLIVTDLNMPVMNGDEMVRLIRSDPQMKHVSVIIIASLKKTDMERCASCGANDCITRPLDPKKLFEKISRLLDVPERRAVRVLIKVTVKGNLGIEPFFGSTLNISASGLLLETEKILARGDIVTCSFFLPDSERILADCEVMRVAKRERQFLYGLRFIELTEKDKDSIEGFINRNKPASPN